MTDETILIVGRDARFLGDMQRNLAGLEAAVAVAPDPAHVEPLPHYAVVVMELDGPEFEGAELIRRLAASSPFTECIIASHTPQNPVVRELYELGNVYSVHCRQPDAAGALYRDVIRALERRALRRHNAYLLIELRDARDDLRNQAEFLAQVERLATLGQMVDDLAADLAPKLADLGAGIAAIAGSCANSGDVREVRSRSAVLADLVDECRSACTAVLEFGRGDAGSVMPVDLSDVVSASLGWVGHSVRAHSIRLHVDVPRTLPKVWAHPYRLQQALTHVIVNAIQAMPHGGVLRIRGEGGDGGDGAVRLHVADTGPGISPEILDHVFDAFFTTRPPGRGSGLGLTVARRILRDYGGDIEVVSRVGRGATFTLQVPAIAVESASGRLEAAA
ncbi:MAG: sensor histidine kinase [Chthonomonadales bacterium]